MNPKHVLILTAVQIEAKAIRKTLPVSIPIQVVGMSAKFAPLPGKLQNFELILMCGLAGGLDPALKIGDVILDDPAGRIGSSIVKRGAIHTAAQIVSSPQQKADLFRQTGAIAVDMEQSIIRQLNSNVIGIRAISDTSYEVLDPAVMYLVDAMGRPRPLKIAGQLIRRPGLIPYLRTLSKNTNIALAALAKTVQTVVNELEGK